MNIDECFEIADYLQQTEPVDYEEQRKGASAIWWLIEQNRQLQAENEALKCHCGRPLFETQDIIHTKTECLMRKAQKK